MRPGVAALMAVAPLVVVVALAVFRDVFAVFLLYHVGLCLLLPAVVNLLVRRRGWRGHAAGLGLGGPTTGRPFLAGAGLGILAAAGVVLFLKLWPDALPSAGSLDATLTSWGAGPERRLPLVLFMGLVNGPAEELFWRGFVATELAAWRRRRAALILPSLAYASYHGFTVMMLADSAVVAAVMLAGVLAAGLGWAWMRERTGSVWPALISHAAATYAYMAAAWPILVF